LSPQTRRGKAAPASHRKSSSRGTSTTTRKAASGVQAGEETQLDETQLEDQAAAPVRPRRRARGIARLRRTSGYRYVSEAVGAYVPLIIAFVVLFGGVWAWISFGPHAPTAKDHWLQIESTWLPKVQHDRQLIAETNGDYTSQIAAYSTLGTDLTGWTTDLSKIASWDSADATPDPSSGSSTPNSDLTQAFINAAQQQASNIDSLTRATTGLDIDAAITEVRAGDSGLEIAYVAAYHKIVGTYPPSSLNSKPTLAVPSLGVCPAATPSDTPGTSPSPADSSAATSPSPAVSTSPGPSPTIQLCMPKPVTQSPGPAGSAG
jgi:hypothetical protein